MFRARSLSTTAIGCAAVVGFLAASGCNKPRNNPTTSNASVATPSDTTGAYGATPPSTTPSTTPSTRTPSSSSSLRTGSDASGSMASAPRRSRTGRHVGRPRSTDTTSTYGGFTPSVTGTANGISSSSSVTQQGDTGKVSANLTSPDSGSSSSSATQTGNRDTSGAITAGARNDTTWVYGGSNPTRDTSRIDMNGRDTVPAAMHEPSQASPSPLSDGQVTDLVFIANTADSTAGELAATRSANSDVKTFARQMVQDHGASNRAMRELAGRVNIAPVSSDDSRDLRSDADDALRTLQSKSGAEFDRAYIDGEVDMHERVLRALDDKLIPAADNAELRTALQQTRTVVAQHLERARQIQSTLRSQ